MQYNLIKLHIGTYNYAEIILKLREQRKMQNNAKYRILRICTNRMKYLPGINYPITTNLEMHFLFKFETYSLTMFRNH